MPSTDPDSPTLSEALKGPMCDEWFNAVHYELSQLDKLHTWDLVVPPPNINIIPSHFITKIKQNEHGEISKYKI